MNSDLSTGYFFYQYKNVNCVIHDLDKKIKMLDWCLGDWTKY